MRVVFEIPGTPIAQPRHKITARGKFAHAYIPKSHAIHEHKQAARNAAMLEWVDPETGRPLPPTDKPVRMCFMFVMPRPKDKCWKTRPTPRYPHTGKPDTDNLVKGLKDALEGILYHNDSQVYAEFARKYVASGEEEPHTTVSVWVRD